jgi:predicted membrane channel-forming protein YqfA (hemolysin III family)
MCPFDRHVHAAPSRSRPHLETCDFDQAPPVSRKDYPYIKTGFIKPNYTLWNGLATLFELNNETTNVLTQLAGLILFYFTYFRVKTASEEVLGSYAQGSLKNLQNGTNNTQYDYFCDRMDSVEGYLVPAVATLAPVEVRRFWLEAVLLADCVCCTFSLIYHMYRVMNLKWFRLLSCLDWSGCTVVGIATSLAADMTLLSLDTLPSWISPNTHGILTTAGFIAMISYWFSGRSSHATRFGSMAVIAFGAAGPCILATINRAPKFGFLSLGWLLFAGTIFSTHFPERLIPRRFDLYLSSHTIWHVGYIVGLLFCHLALCVALFGRCDFMFTAM